MKYLIKTLACVLLLSPTFAHAVPTFYFTTAAPYDQMCARGFDFEALKKTEEPKNLKEAWSEELDARVGEFEKKWNEGSPKLFKILTEEFHKDFARKEYSVALSACESAPSMPFPLVLNVSRFLKSYWDGKPAKSMDLFLDLPFHELLHIWLGENYPKLNLLGGKYAQEPKGVRNHVPLFAVESLIYEKAEQPEIWKSIREFVMKSGGAHKRAMEILDKEGRDKILKDLK